MILSYLIFFPQYKAARLGNRPPAMCTSSADFNTAIHRLKSIRSSIVMGTF